MSRPLVASLLVFLLPSGVLAQSEAVESKRSLPLVLAVGTHALSFPLYNKPLTYRFNPVAMLGTEFTHTASSHLRLTQPLNLGFFQHEFVESGVFLNTDLALSYLTSFGLHADLLLGAGYLHAFSRRDVFELKDGQPSEVTDWGQPSVMLSLAGALGYEVQTRRSLSVSPFIQYRWFVQTPSPYHALTPALSHVLLTAGAKIHFPGR